MAPDPYALYDHARMLRRCAECAKNRALAALYDIRVIGVLAAEARFHREMSSVSVLNELAASVSLQADKILIAAAHRRSFRRAWHRSKSYRHRLKPVS